MDIPDSPVVKKNLSLNLQGSQLSSVVLKLDVRFVPSIIQISKLTI